MKKILLNCLPPADVNCPSASLSILKSFLANNGFETEVKYWNFLLSVMSNYSNITDSEIKILPFLSILNDLCNNTTDNNRIISLLHEIHPSYQIHSNNYYLNFLKNTKSRIIEIINEELQKIDFSAILLFGISSKFHQWIPGMILSEEIKKISPNTKIIVGGLGSKEAARDVLKTCKYFDYATWGEGEYPLLELSKQLRDNSNNFDLVPRLLYRDFNNIKQSPIIKSEFLDLQKYILPEYDDYFNNLPVSFNKNQIRFPLNTIRACNWNKCLFCDYNKGYKYRSRNPECIIKEMEYFAEKYGITSYSFVDSDIFGNLERFERMLDLIIESRNKGEYDYIFWAEMIPNSQLNEGLLRKMAIAGFKQIFIGYDSMADSLLEKMNKSSSFSDNLFFIKFSLKYKIFPIVNVIRGVPDEIEEEVQDSMNNLHFLRFFYNDKDLSFSHRFVNFELHLKAKYFSLISEKEKVKYNFNIITYLSSEYFLNHNHCFSLFGWKKNVLDHFIEWEKLQSIENYYKVNKFSFIILEYAGIHFYTEYCNNEIVNEIVFNESEYMEVLKLSNNKVCVFNELFTEIKKSHPELTAERLKNIIIDLKESYLVYCNKEFSNVISIIDVN